MKYLPTILCLSLMSMFSGCRDTNAEKRLATMEKKWADLEERQNQPWVPDATWPYTWFNLGQEYRQTVNSAFYVSKISTTYKENGFQVQGVIGNLSSIPMSVVRVQVAIKNSDGKNITFGTSDLPFLLAGQKTLFSVFVPTSETKITQVGVQVIEYRQ